MNSQSLEGNSKAFPIKGRGLGPGIFSASFIIGLLFALKYKYAANTPTAMTMSTAVTISAAKMTKVAQARIVTVTDLSVAGVTVLETRISLWLGTRQLLTSQ
jgi:hypothetical protein